MDTEVMHLSSSKGRVVLAPMSRGSDGRQRTRAQLGQDPPQRTVLGVLTENGQYRKTCDQVMTEKRWGSCLLRRALLSCWEVGFLLQLYLQILLEYFNPGIWIIGTLDILR